MNAEYKAIEKKVQSEVDQYKAIQKGEWNRQNNIECVFAACFGCSKNFSSIDCWECVGDFYLFIPQ